MLKVVNKNPSRYPKGYAIVSLLPCKLASKQDIEMDLLKPVRPSYIDQSYATPSTHTHTQFFLQSRQNHSLRLRSLFKEKI